MSSKISCLTVTGWRLPLLKDSIACYLRQSYPNRELVIVCDGSPHYNSAVARYVKSLSRQDIRLIITEQRCSLGQLRNIAIDAATGPVIVQWDDDDLYHPHRLQWQYEWMTAQHAHACLLADHLSFFQRTGDLYWVDWKPYSTFPMHQLFPGSIMAYKDQRFRYPEAGEFSSRGEDSIFLTQYYQETNVTGLAGRGYMYVYRYHGSNTFSEPHHQWVARAHLCHPNMIQEKMPELLDAFEYYNLPQPLTVRTMNDRSMFTYKQ